MTSLTQKLVGPSATSALLASARGSLQGAFWRGIAVRTFEKLTTARVLIKDRFGTSTYGASAAPLAFTMVVHDDRAYRALATGGSIGAGEGYAKGWWTVDDLPGLLRAFAVDLDAVESLDRGMSRLRAPLFRALDRVRGRDRKGARRNIAFHYDVGNDFFEHILDPTMMYSSAYFEKGDHTLEAASLAKLRRVCEKLDLGPDDHLLEIGSGWGGLASYAVQNFGCRVTTTTISAEQARYCRQRFERDGVDRRIRLLESDYRDIEGRFDKIVSIEMIEAIGADQYRTFFKQTSKRLPANGVMLVQAITIADQRFEQARREVDFIKHHVFPGSCIPSVTALCSAMTAASDFRLIGLEDISAHYAETLRHWRRRLGEASPKLLEAGRNETFMRMWDFYFAYCEAAFDARYIGDAQMLFAKPHYEGGAIRAM